MGVCGWCSSGFEVVDGRDARAWHGVQGLWLACMFSWSLGFWMSSGVEAPTLTVLSGPAPER